MRENMNKPIIGLTTYQRERNAYCVVVTDYIDSVFTAGGIPVNIPTIENEDDYDYYMKMLDGILFTGGVDINPKFYGEEPLKEINSIVSAKDTCELGLFKKAYEKGMPIFGVCRGSQLINVALGGKLYQDIYRQIPNSFGHYPNDILEDELYHSVNIAEGSRLHNIMGADKLYVNSFHHQAIKTLGNNLVVSAVSSDNIIEAIESNENRFLLGVQWHPEILTKKYPEFLKLFNQFNKAAVTYKLNKR